MGKIRSDIWLTDRLRELIPQLCDPIIWRPTAQGDFIWPGIRAYPTVDHAQLIAVFAHDDRIDSASINDNGDFLCVLSDRGWETMCTDALNIYREMQDCAIDPAERITVITRKYLDHRYRHALHTMPIPQISLREDIHNPVYLQWYAYSYAQRWLQHILTVKNHTIRDCDSLYLERKYMVAQCVLLAQIIKAPIGYQCHYSEQIARLLLAYIPWVPGNDSTTEAIRLGVHILSVMMKLHRIFPAQLI